MCPGLQDTASAASLNAVACDGNDPAAIKARSAKASQCGDPAFQLPKTPVQSSAGVAGTVCAPGSGSASGNNNKRGLPKDDAGAKMASAMAAMAPAATPARKTRKRALTFHTSRDNKEDATSSSDGVRANYSHIAFCLQEICMRVRWQAACQCCLGPAGTSKLGSLMWCAHAGF